MNQEKHTTKAKKFQHLNNEERKIIERLLGKGTSKAEISKILRRNISTIKREINRGTAEQIRRNPSHSKKIEIPEFIRYQKYFAETGQRRYYSNRQNCGAKNKIIACRDLVEGSMLKFRT